MLVFTAKFSTLAELQAAVFDAIRAVNKEVVIPRATSQIVAQVAPQELRIVKSLGADNMFTFNFFIVDPDVAGAGRVVS